jgi:hypothetical protein
VVIEARVQQTPRSLEHTAMRLNRETLWMKAELYTSRFLMCGNPFVVIRRADAQPADAVPHPHRISAVGPEQEIHRKESWQGLG